MPKTLLLILFSLILIVLPVEAQEASVTSGEYWPTLGWHTASPTEHGLDADLLATIPDQIEEHMPFVHSLLIVRHGDLVFEHYFAGYSPTSLNEMMSVTKSVTSALTGIALQNGDIPSLDVSFASLFPEYFAGSHNADKRDLTLRHLLTMRSGLDWSDSSAPILWQGQGDQIAAMMDRPLVAEPGSGWNYSTGDTQLLSALFTRSTGLSLEAYASDHLFAPLGITQWEWVQDSQSYSIGGARLSLTARDMAKFGYLYLHQGFWDGDQIIPAAWVRLTTTGQEDQPDYGYLWWVHELGSACGFAAHGYAGQSIVVCPELDMVVVTTTTAFVLQAVADAQNQAIDQLLEQSVLPAVVDAP